MGRFQCWLGQRGAKCSQRKSLAISADRPLVIGKDSWSRLIERVFKAYLFRGKRQLDMAFLICVGGPQASNWSGYCCWVEYLLQTLHMHARNTLLLC
jgi:hypothetical protein